MNPTPEQPTTCFVMFAIIVVGFFATVLHAVTDTWWQRVALFFILGPIVVAFLGLVKRTHREDGERFNRQMNNLTSAQENFKHSQGGRTLDL